MRKSMRKTDEKVKIILAWVALVATLFVVLFSSAYIATHMHHDCIGESCPICHMLLQCAQNIKTAGSAIASDVAFIVVFFCYFKIKIDKKTFSYIKSLVSLKVRMDN